MSRTRLASAGWSRASAVIRADVMSGYALEAGFGAIERLDEPELDMLRIYRLTQ
jgi:hypothetical protein